MISKLFNCCFIIRRLKFFFPKTPILQALVSYSIEEEFCVMSDNPVTSVNWLIQVFGEPVDFCISMHYSGES